ncbi:hypothetical protein [Nocardia jinanensis]|uniref:Uncharacterized protein n=1 Tax=Nocardia jinanensis TaxID=382504 RepID=A0A917VQQ7_9NOCA|nr:hypothetical protein [Nocardia jinanensis]GGL04741.1 hypothetical protein GCM10011588_19110 [Nocardia jinanensis]
MTGTRYRQPEGVAEFADELRLLAEAVLERVEPVLRDAAADGQPEWNNCTWCPLCAAAALVRGEHHEVLATVAAHGTAIVTVLREALAGAPVEPVVAHRHSPETGTAPGHPRPDTTGGDEDPDDSVRLGDSGSDATDAAETGAGGNSPGERGAPTSRSRYVGIPVNIKQ